MTKDEVKMCTGVLVILVGAAVVLWQIMPWFNWVIASVNKALAK